MSNSNPSSSEVIWKRSLPIVLVLGLLIVFVVIFLYLSYTYTAEILDPEQSPLSTILEERANYITGGGRWCGQEQVPCTGGTPGECLNVCRRDGFFYTCNNNVCSIDLKTVDPRDCELAKGGVVTLGGATETGNAILACHCLFPEYFNGPTCDTQALMCEGGIFMFDINKEVPTVDSCTCPPGHTKMGYRSSPSTREIPHCVQSESVNSYEEMGYYTL